MRISRIAGVVAIVASVVQVDAAVHYVAVTSVGQGASYTVAGWAEGSKGRVDVTQSTGLAVKTGDFLLTRDGAQTIDRVEPAKAAYFRWDPATLWRALETASVQPGMRSGAVATPKPVEPTVEVLTDEDGGLYAGYATRHLRVRVTYVSQEGPARMRRGAKDAAPATPPPTVRDEEIWLAPDLKDPGLGVWLAGGASPTGDASLDAKIAALLPPTPGACLKRVLSVTATRFGRASETRSSMEVTEIGIKDAPEGIFLLPQGFSELRLRPPKGGGMRMDSDGSEGPGVLGGKPQGQEPAAQPTATPKP